MEGNQPPQPQALAVRQSVRMTAHGLDTSKACLRRHWLSEVKGWIPEQLKMIETASTTSTSKSQYPPATTFGTMMHRLVELGFTSLYLVGGSTGATLMLTALLEGSFSSLKPLKHLILVDTLVSPKNKTLYALPYLRWFYSKQTVILSAEEEGHWLPQRPTHALLEASKTDRNPA